MKSFSEYLAEAEAEQDSDGTYASLLVSEKSRNQLYDWMVEQKINNLIDKEDYHCTIVYSKKVIPEVETLQPELPIIASILGWKVFADKILVLTIKNSKIVKLHNETRDMGATWDFDEYIPHITISENFIETIPTKLPKFKLSFDEFHSEELDLKGDE